MLRIGEFWHLVYNWKSAFRYHKSQLVHTHSIFIHDVQTPLALLPLYTFTPGFSRTPNNYLELSLGNVSASDHYATPRIKAGSPDTHETVAAKQADKQQTENNPGCQSRRTQHSDQASRVFSTACDLDYDQQMCLKRVFQTLARAHTLHRATAVVMHRNGLSCEARVEDCPLPGGSRNAASSCPLRRPRYFMKMSGSQQNISCSKTLPAQGPQFFLMAKEVC